MEVKFFGGDFTFFGNYKGLYFLYKFKNKYYFDLFSDLLINFFDKIFIIKNLIKIKTKLTTNILRIIKSSFDINTFFSKIYSLV